MEQPISPSEMLLSDTYHRAKRAALAFSALLLLLNFANVAGSFEMPSEVGGITLNPWVAKIFLLFAALYHVWVFHLEYGAAKLMNSELARSGAMAGFDNRVREVNTRLEEAGALFRKGASDWDKIQAPVPQQIDTQVIHATNQLIQNVRSQVFENLHHRTPGGPTKSPDPFDQRFDMIERTMLSAGENLSNIGKEIEQRVAAALKIEQERHKSEGEAALQIIKTAEANLGALDASVNALSGAIARQKIISFRWADNAAVWSLFVCALATMPFSNLEFRCSNPSRSVCWHNTIQQQSPNIPRHSRALSISTAS